MFELLSEKEYEEKYLGVEMPEYDFSEGDAEEIAKELISIMCAHKGLGLSAPQVGLEISAFAIGNPDEPENCSVIFNPKITSYSKEQVIVPEGCLSYPELFVKVKRPEKIRMRMTDLNNKKTTEWFDGLTARVVQHEYDYLKGINFLERANPIHIQQAKRKRKLLLRKRKKVNK